MSIDAPILPPPPNTPTQFAGYEGELDTAALPIVVSSTALSSSIIVKSGVGKLFGFSVYNTNSSAQFILMFDANSLPADGAVPIGVFVAGAGGTSATPAGALGVYYGSTGLGFTRGIALCNSSTASTKTIGAADCLFSAQYV
jgi:hypothetical protein